MSNLVPAGKKAVELFADEETPKTAAVLLNGGAFARAGRCERVQDAREEAPEDAAPYSGMDPTLPNPDYPDLNVPSVKRMMREYLSSVTCIDRMEFDDKGQIKPIRITMEGVGARPLK